MPTSRLEAFSDGVFAFAFTLLVLNFHTPGDGEHLGAFLTNLWPTFFACSISFLLIGLVWANHHSMFVHIKQADRNLMFLNVLLLADVAFIPFPTEVLAQALRTGTDLQDATLLYGLTLTIGGIFFNAVWFYATARPELLNVTVPKQYIGDTRRRFLAGPLLHGVATLTAIILPIVSVFGYAALAVYFWLPPRDEAKALLHRYEPDDH